jgi:glycosyltransferase involved in cell wall biosynthesis
VRILVLTDHFPPDSPGGAGQVALIQCRALQRLGHDVQVLSARQDESAPADIQVEGVPVHRLKIAYPPRWRAYLSLYNPAAARAVSAFLDRVRPDIVHAHNVHTYLTYHSLALVRRRSLPVVLTTHDVMSAAYQKFDSFIDPTWQHVPTEFDYRVTPRSQIRKQRFRYFPLRNAIIRRMIGRHVNAIISPSRALIDFLQANRVYAPQMIVVHNGIDPALFESSRAEQAAFRADQGLEGRRIILFAGRINRAKGGEQILKALPRIVDRVPDAVLLVLAQPGGYGEAMLSQAKLLGVREHIHFAGWLGGRALASAFGAADVCVIPSVCFDSFPTVALEAQAAGTPVVATCFGGAREAVIDGQTGFIVNPYNVEMLAGRITRLLADDALRAAMGERAHQRVREHFDWLAQAGRLVEIYRQVSDLT